MKWTGERLTTEVVGEFGTIEHLHRYAIVLDMCKNKTVLDIASGEGYGTNLISKYADFVYGVDISEEAINHAKLKYEKSSQNTSFIIGSTSKIPLEDGSVDIVVSFETIEHHNQHSKMMMEIKRVLKDDGILILSSPEKSIYSERDPNNQFHIKELTLEELLRLTSSFFSHYKVFEQKFIIGSFIHIKEQIEGNMILLDGDFDKIQRELSNTSFFNKPYFNIVICSNMPIEESIPNLSFFNGSIVYDRQQQKHYTELKRLQNKIIATNQSLPYKFSLIFTKPLFVLKSIITRAKH